MWFRLGGTCDKGLGIGRFLRTQDRTSISDRSPFCGGHRSRGRGRGFGGLWWQGSEGICFQVMKKLAHAMREQVVFLGTWWEVAVSNQDATF